MIAHMAGAWEICGLKMTAAGCESPFEKSIHFHDYSLRSAQVRKYEKGCENVSLSTLCSDQNLSIYVRKIYSMYFVSEYS